MINTNVGTVKANTKSGAQDDDPIIIKECVICGSTSDPVQASKSAH